MSYALLVISQPGKVTREFAVGDEVVTIGRALDNTICLDGDTNVSRYHAEIEKRGEIFWLLELGSSNGTTVNDVPVEGEHELQDGDLIGVGGSTVIELQLSHTPWAEKQHHSAAAALETPQEEGHREAPESLREAVTPDVSSTAASVPAATGSAAPEAAAAVQRPAASQLTKGPSLMLILAGVGGGLLLTGLVAVLIWSRMSPACNPRVHITSPQTGTTIREPTPIRVEVQDPKCIDRVIYQLDGEKIASSEFPPFDCVLDPEKLADVDSGTHLLSVTVEDQEGNKKLQAETLLLAFDRGRKARQATPGTPPPPVSMVEVKELCINLAKEFSPSKTEYQYDAEFLGEVQARTSDYAVEGFSERVRPFRDVINTSFIQEQGLDQPLGYVLAMSRSGFSLVKGSGAPPGDATAAGLWRMTQAFAQSNGYSGRCGTETLADPSQRCAALVAAAYSKAIVINLFEGDFFYAVASFGMAPQEAGAWRALLPADRSNFWKVIKSPEQRERVVRFFAAGIVGENPRKFGLTRDRPLSSFYPKK
jgi:hypothetical protein